MIRKILVPIDGSKVSQKAAQYAVELAKDTGASVLLLSVIDTRFIVSQAVSASASPTHVRESVEDWEKMHAQVLAIVDSAGSSGTLAVMPVIQQLELVNLAKSSTNPRLYAMSGKGGNPWAFRINIDDTMIARSYGAFVAQRTKSLAVLAYNVATTLAFMERYAEALPFVHAAQDIEAEVHGADRFGARLPSNVPG